MSVIEGSSLTKLAAKPVKFFMMDSYVSIFFFAIFIFQNLFSVILAVVAIMLSIGLRNNGYPMSMMIRVITSKVAGRKRRMHYPEKRRDHLFTD